MSRPNPSFFCTCCGARKSGKSFPVIPLIPGEDPAFKARQTNGSKNVREGSCERCVRISKMPYIIVTKSGDAVPCLSFKSKHFSSTSPVLAQLFPPRLCPFLFSCVSYVPLIFPYFPLLFNLIKCIRVSRQGKRQGGKENSRSLTFPLGSLNHLRATARAPRPRCQWPPCHGIY